MTSVAELPTSILDSKIFNGLKDAEMKLLIKEASLKKYKTGESVLKEGDEGTDFYWISSGRVEINIVSTAKGQSVLKLSELAAGDVLGEMSLLGFTKRAASAVVIAEANIYAWKLQTVLNLFIDYPAMGYRVTRNLGHMLGERLINANKLLKGSSESLDAKVVRNLV